MEPQRDPQAHTERTELGTELNPRPLQSRLLAGAHRDPQKGACCRGCGAALGGWEAPSGAACVHLRTGRRPRSPVRGCARDRLRRREQRAPRSICGQFQTHVRQAVYRTGRQDRGPASGQRAAEQEGPPVESDKELWTLRMATAVGTRLPGQKATPQPGSAGCPGEPAGDKPPGPATQQSGGREPPPRWRAASGARVQGRESAGRRGEKAIVAACGSSRCPRCPGSVTRKRSVTWVRQAGPHWSSER